MLRLSVSSLRVSSCVFEAAYLGDLTFKLGLARRGLVGDYVRKLIVRFPCGDFTSKSVAALRIENPSSSIEISLDERNAAMAARRMANGLPRETSIFNQSVSTNE